MIIEFGGKKGIKLKTGGKLCESDISVKPKLSDVLIAQNGKFLAEEGFAGFGEVTVEVPVPDGYVLPEGELSVTENGVFDVSAYKSVSVDIEISEPYVGGVSVGEFLCFHVDGELCECEKGATWADFAESAYCLSSLGLSASENAVTVGTSVLYSHDTALTPDDVIADGGVYTSASE